MTEKLKQHRDDFDLRITGASSIQELKQLRSDFLGKKGCVSMMLKEMRSLPSDKKPQAGKYITKYTPPAFLEAKGNEDAPYSYNRERNESMFGMNLN